MGKYDGRSRDQKQGIGLARRKSLNGFQVVFSESPILASAWECTSVS